MKHARTHTFVWLPLLALLLLGVPACSGSEDSRVTALESEVKALKQKIEERDTAYRQELAQVRKNLEVIQGLLNIDKGGEALGGNESTPEEKALREKAKEFVDKNLDKLMDVTKRLLEKMEKELDEQLQDMEQPAPPQGDQI